MSSYYILLMLLYIVVLTDAQSTTTTNAPKLIYEITNKWNTGFQGELNIPIRSNITAWTVVFKFFGPIEALTAWSGKIISAEKGEKIQEYIFQNHPYNGKLIAGSVFKFDFNGKFVEDDSTTQDKEIPPLTVSFNGLIIYSNSGDEASEAFKLNEDIISLLDKITTTTTSTTTTTTVSTTTIPWYMVSSNLTIIQIVPEVSDQDTEFIPGSGDEEDIPTVKIPTGTESSTVSVPETDATVKTSPPPTVPTTARRRTTTPRPRPMPFNYKLVLHKSLLFYEAQRTGKLPPTNRVPWRGDSMLNDLGNDEEDLTGGYFDAGDHVKFAFPMTYSMTTIAWGVIEYMDVYTAAGELEYALDCIKWGVDWIMKAHVGKDEFYGQVGDGEEDHAIWNRPEDIYILRQPYKITAKKPGSDLAAEASAALSAAYIAFKKYGKAPYSDDAYLLKLRQHSIQLYNFADNYRGLYHMSIKDAAQFYKSTSYADEITWAATWLYRATANSKWLRAAQGKYQNQGQFNLPYELQFSWDDKTAGFQLLLAQVTQGNTQSYYKTPVQKYCKAVRDDKEKYTRKGLYFQREWSPLRHAANVAFICMMAADLEIDKDLNTQFAKTQIHYMLGSTGRSYVVGFGRNYPKQPHHRASSCPARPQHCGFQALDSQKPNPHILEGALVGGPDFNDKYSDERKKFKNTEVTLDHNSCFQGAVAAIYRRYLYGPNRAIDRSSEDWFVKPTTPTRQVSSTTSSASTLASGCIITLYLLASPFALLKFFFH